MQQRRIQEGMKVHSSDGSELGKVIACEDDFFIIEKGFFFPKDYTARYDQVAEIKNGEVWLGESGQQLGGGVASRPAGMTEELRVPIAEEEVTAEKRERDAGEVRVHKTVTTEQKQVSVPVTREEVHVERVPVHGEAAPSEASFQEGTVSVPIREEEVEIRKRPVIREEVRVTKTPLEEEVHRTAQVRREEAEVTREGAPSSARHR